MNATQSLLNAEIKSKQRIVDQHFYNCENLENSLKSNVTFLDIFYIKHHLNILVDCYAKNIKSVHMRKLDRLGI